MPDIASKRWVYEQYDSTVQASHGAAPGADAAVSFGSAAPISASP